MTPLDAVVVTKQPEDPQSLEAHEKLPVAVPVFTTLSTMEECWRPCFRWFNCNNKDNPAIDGDNKNTDEKRDDDEATYVGEEVFSDDDEDLHDDDDNKASLVFEPADIDIIIDAETEIREGSITSPSYYMITDTLSDITCKYHVDGEVIGTGNFGEVRKCKNRETNEWFAVKTIDKSKIRPRDVKDLQSELSILKQLHNGHENIINLVDTYEDACYLHIITDLVTGGELYDTIVDTIDIHLLGRFDEHDAANIMYEALNAIAHCHEQNIIHRDVKPENFLFVKNSSFCDSHINDDDYNNNNKYKLKLIDFGLSTRHDENDTRCVGTPYYIAPEVLHRTNYDTKCDIWSLGVIAFMMLGGYAPFQGNTDAETFQRIRTPQAVTFPLSDWNDVSYDAISFISSLLSKDPTLRPTAKDAMNHRWIKRHVIAKKNSIAASYNNNHFEHDYCSSGRNDRIEKAEVSTTTKQQNLQDLGENLTS